MAHSNGIHDTKAQATVVGSRGEMRLKPPSHAEFFRQRDAGLTGTRREQNDRPRLDEARQSYKWSYSLTVEAPTCVAARQVRGLTYVEISHRRQPQEQAELADRHRDVVVCHQQPANARRVALMLKTIDKFGATSRTASDRRVSHGIGDGVECPKRHVRFRDCVDEPSQGGGVVSSVDADDVEFWNVCSFREDRADDRRDVKGLEQLTTKEIRPDVPYRHCSNSSLLTRPGVLNGH